MNNVSITDYDSRRIFVKGDTYPIRKELKEIGGGNWDAPAKAWIFPKEKKAEIKKLLASKDLLASPTKDKIKEVREVGDKKESRKLYFKKVLKMEDNVPSNKDNRIKVDRYILSFDGYDKELGEYAEFRKSVEISKKGKFAGFIESLIPKETTHDEMSKLEYYYVDNPFTPDTYAWQLELLEKVTPKGKVEETEYNIFKDFLLKNMSTSPAPTEKVGKESDEIDFVIKKDNSVKLRIKKFNSKFVSFLKRNENYRFEKTYKFSDFPDDPKKGYYYYVTNNTIANKADAEKLVEKIRGYYKENFQDASPAPTDKVGKESFTQIAKDRANRLSKMQ